MALFDVDAYATPLAVPPVEHALHMVVYNVIVTEKLLRADHVSSCAVSDNRRRRVCLIFSVVAPQQQLCAHPFRYLHLFQYRLI